MTQLEAQNQINEKGNAQCLSCKIIGTTVSLGASGYLLQTVYSSKPPIGFHRVLMLAFAGGFAALGVARALV